MNNKNYYNINSVMSALNCKKGFGLGSGNSKKLSSFVECWNGIS